jgi:anti-anti-sigma factor
MSINSQSCIEVSGDSKTAVVAFATPTITDVKKITAASEHLKQYVQKNHPKTVVFDFAAVKFFSSQVLGLILATRANLLPAGGEVVISGINPQLHRIFKITNLDRIFRFSLDRDSAVKNNQQ